MRSSSSMTKLSLACAAVLAVAVSCKHTSSNMTSSSEPSDGGAMMMDADAGSSSSMTSSDAGMGSMSSPSGSTQSGGQGQMMADAGMATYGSAPSTAAPSTGASTGATTAADAARSASAGATNAANDTATAAAAPAAAATLSDAQIAGVTAAAHQGEIDAAKLARKHSKNAKVRAFAARMIKDHTGALKEETALAAKAGLTPADSDTSAKVKQMCADAATQLQGLKGKEFDKAYAQAQVDAHTQVLDSLDNTLIPAAQNADLKAQLQKERPVVAEHLEHAKKLVADLGGGPAAQ